MKITRTITYTYEVDVFDPEHNIDGTYHERATQLLAQMEADPVGEFIDYHLTDCTDVWLSPATVQHDPDEMAQVSDYDTE